MNPKGVFALVALWIGLLIGTCWNMAHANAPRPVVAHPPLVNVQYRDRIVYRWKPDINALLYKGHQICRADGGLSTLLIFPSVPNNAEFLCAWGHDAFTDSGMKL